MTVQSGNDQGRKAALIFVSAISQDGQVSAGDKMMDTSNSAVLLSGTANFDVGDVEDKLTVFHTDATTIFNRMAQKVELVVFVVWT